MFVRQSAVKILSKSLDILPVRILKKVSGARIILPVYHTVTDKRLPHVINLFRYRSIDQFEKDLDFFQKNFTPVSLSDVVDQLRGSCRIPVNSFLLSFDDGYKEIYEVIAPILKRRSIPAVFFITNAFVDNKQLFYRNKASLIIEKLNPIANKKIVKELEDFFRLNIDLNNLKSEILKIDYGNKDLLDRIAEIVGVDFDAFLKKERPYMTMVEIKELVDQGFDVGSHSIDHPLFRNIDLEEQIMQVKSSIELLKEHLVLKVNAFAFPYNDQNVKKSFFEQSHLSGLIDVSFGLSDFREGNFPNNLQRQAMERNGSSAEDIYRSLFIKQALIRANLTQITS
jgi:peptidoglycan/xylan/chitin deacetylase (PgdA/CDA1 family)